MSYWDLHFLAGFLVSLLILTIYGFGFWEYSRRSYSQGLSHQQEDHFMYGTFFYFTAWLFLLGLLHLWLDTYNPILFIGG
jgi:cytochrome b561